MKSHALKWAVPAAEPLTIAMDYVKAVKDGGVRGVWAKVDGVLLRLSTLIPDDDRAVESAVYDAEMQTMRAWPDVPIEFRVIREGDEPEIAGKRKALGQRLL